MDGVELRRPLPPGRYALRDLATGLEKSPPLCELLGEDCERFLSVAKAELVEDWGYMWVDNDDGTLFASAEYWNTGDAQGLYLDLVHELVHVKQHHDGRDLFDHSYKYVARPTELEAYRVVVQEARRLGMGEADLSEFLYVEWISREEHQELCAACGVTWHDRKR